MAKKISELKKEAVAASGLATDSRWKKWVKWIDKVDDTKTTGFAFVGPFIDDGTVEYEIGTPRLLLVASETGSNRYRQTGYQVVEMRPDGELVAIEGLSDTDARKGWALRLRDKVAARLQELSGEETNPLAEFSDEDLIREVERRGYYVVW